MSVGGAADPAVSAPHAGGCVCGRVRFSGTGEPLWSVYCHCGDCRAATGAPVTLWVGFSADSVIWSGERNRRAGQTDAVERGFCAACGAPLSYADATIPGGEIYLPIGAFDAPERIRPEAHAFWASRLPFLVMDDGLPKHPTFSRRRSGASGPTAIPAS